eukprot:TRINITY_DN12676_c0_g1_i1.p1 TRINITY_DN12676_c0_g1~~TRINITY_DN12676_c0_g1_i1.p1  ORF type:complete len:395 (+),score=101.45 TRINITY_DN12676_c0_g1_i1:76-1185(+)
MASGGWAGSVEGFRAEAAPAEDRRIKVPQQGKLPLTACADFPALAAAVTNSPATPAGLAHIAYGDRQFLLVYFPPESRTPPSYMFFNRGHLVGNLTDRLCAAVEIRAPPCAADDPQRWRLYRLRTQQELHPAGTLASCGLDQHEPVVLSQGPRPAPFWPAATREASDPVCGGPAPPSAPADAGGQEEQPAPPDDAAAGAGAAEALLGAADTDPDSPAEPPPGVLPLAQRKFANKKGQPNGDGVRPGATRVVVAVFIADGPPQGWYQAFDAAWVAGRCCDAALSRAGAKNPNLSTPDPEDRLSLYSLRTLRRLPNSTPVGAAGLCSGDAVLVAKARGMPRWAAAEAARLVAPEPSAAKQAAAQMRQCTLM